MGALGVVCFRNRHQLFSRDHAFPFSVGWFSWSGSRLHHYALPNTGSALTHVAVWVWHETLSGGTDTEFALVVAALCVGVSYVAARLIFKSEFIPSIFSSVFADYSGQLFTFVLRFHPFRFPATIPPVLPLRI